MKKEKVTTLIAGALGCAAVGVIAILTPPLAVPAAILVAGSAVAQAIRDRDRGEGGRS